MSKPLTVTIPHELGRQEARRRIDQGLDGLLRQVSSVGEVSHGWDGDVLRFTAAALGQRVTGLIEVAEREVRLEVLLPGVLAILADKVRGRIRRHGQVLLEDRSKR